MDVTIVKVNPQGVRLGGVLPGERSMYIDVIPRAQDLTFVVWLCTPGGEASIWTPGAAAPGHDILTPHEELILSAGMEELAHASIGLSLDTQTIQTIIETVTEIMQAVGGCPVPDD